MNLPVQRRNFFSDNCAGLCPEALAALTAANAGHALSYGDDPWTRQANALIRELFETPCEVFFVFNGTAANALALSAICAPYHSILCHELAHTETGECAAPEFFGGGSRLQLLTGPHGKIDAASLEEVAGRRQDVHAPKPRALSLTQATETGTVYSPDELRPLTELARRLGLRVHADGARFANAVAALGVKPKELSWEAGVDVLTFGATKNGGAVGEAIVFFDPELAREFEYRRKQTGQLASKMRFLAASWVGLLRDGAWLRHARQANSMARRLEAALRDLPPVQIVHPCQTNGVFVSMPPALMQGLRQRGWEFHDTPDSCRLMCSWDTTEEDVDALANDAKSLVKSMSNI
jgi:threonine aldolase